MLNSRNSSRKHTYPKTKLPVSEVLVEKRTRLTIFPSASHKSNVTYIVIRLNKFRSINYKSKLNNFERSTNYQSKIILLIVKYVYY